MNSAQIGDVSTSDWTFKMTYGNTQQEKSSSMSYTLATSGETQFTFSSEDPDNTYVSWCSFFSIQLHYSTLPWNEWYVQHIMCLIQAIGVSECHALECFCARSYCTSEAHKYQK